MKWVCISSGFSKFTYGKIYDEYNTCTDNPLIDIIDDIGVRNFPYLHTDGVYYFQELKEYRSDKIDKILDKELLEMENISPKKQG